MLQINNKIAAAVLCGTLAFSGTTTFAFDWQKTAMGTGLVGAACLAFRAGVQMITPELKQGMSLGEFTKEMAQRNDWVSNIGLFSAICSAGLVGYKLIPQAFDENNNNANKARNGVIGTASAFGALGAALYLVPKWFGYGFTKLKK